MYRNKCKLLCSLLLAVMLSGFLAVVPINAKDQINNYNHAAVQKSETSIGQSSDWKTSFLNRNNGTYAFTMPDGEKVTFIWKKDSTNNWKPQTIKYGKGQLIQCFDEEFQGACEKAAEFATKAIEAAALEDYYSAAIYAVYAAYYYNLCKKGQFQPQLPPEAFNYSKDKLLNSNKSTSEITQRSERIIQTYN